MTRLTQTTRSATTSDATQRIASSPSTPMPPLDITSGLSDQLRHDRQEARAEAAVPDRDGHGADVERVLRAVGRRHEHAADRHGEEGQSRSDSVAGGRSYGRSARSGQSQSDAPASRVT